jgi:hypothetical protein
MSACGKVRKRRGGDERTCVGRGGGVNWDGRDSEGGRAVGARLPGSAAQSAGPARDKTMLWPKITASAYSE